MTELELLIELHRHQHRQGPGSDAATRRALELTGLDSRTELAVADIGCGSGASTLVLAEALDAHITAVDLFPAFLDELMCRAAARGIDHRITPLAASMMALPFDDGRFDLIWSEGAIYSMGFAEGLRCWRRHLKPGGVLAVSEITWLRTDPPAALVQHWQREYPEIDTASAKVAALEAAGYTPVGYFPLAQECWLEHYYRPLEARFPGFLNDHPGEAAEAIVLTEREEIALYEQYRNYFSYGFYIARRAD